MTTNPTSSNQSPILNPQAYYTHPYPTLKRACILFSLATLLSMLITLFLPSGPGTPFVVAYILFTTSASIGLIFFALTDPGIGTYRRRRLPRVGGNEDDGYAEGGNAEEVQVYIARPLFGRKECEKIGGRVWDAYRKGGWKDYNKGYVSYLGLFGGVVRVTWERAWVVVGKGEAEDCTDLVGRDLTRLEW